MTIWSEKLMVNDNIITQKMYNKVRGIIRGELLEFSCPDCKNVEQYPFCDCAMMYEGLIFKPGEEYVSRIALKICLAIGEPIEDLED